MILLLTVTMIPNNSFAVTGDPVVTPTETKEIPAEVKAKLERLEEIKNMDKSNMTRAEKKALRKEVRETKAYLKSTGNGVYLSIGAIIIIILLLILLL